MRATSSITVFCRIRDNRQSVIRPPMTLIFIVILVALAFEYINGFHDTANSIATVVSTKVLSPRQAIVFSASTNLIGALWGTAVAKTIASGLIDTKILSISNEALICALMG